MADQQSAAEKKAEQLAKLNDDIAKARADLAKLREDTKEARQQSQDARRELESVNAQLAEARADLDAQPAPAGQVFPWRHRESGKCVWIVEQGTDVTVEYESGHRTTMERHEFSRDFEATPEAAEPAT